VIGAGPNGLAAAVAWARSGRPVTVFEAEATPGGGARSQPLTLPGFVHDFGSAVHPMAVATSFLPSLPLEQFGLEWIHSPLALAHPFDDGFAAVLDRSLDATAEKLGRDGRAWRKLLAPVVERWPELEADLLGAPQLPRHPLLAARFGVRALPPAAALARARFATPAARALWAGLGAHSLVPLESWGSAAIALMLAAAAHRAGWPIPRGGAQAITNALVAYLRSLGGEVECGHRVEALRELPPAAAIFCDVSPRALAALAADRWPSAYRRRLERFQPGPGVFKMDWALRAPIPWRAPACAHAATVHLGGSLEAITASEAQACARRGATAPGQPFVLLAQPSLFDPSRAPAGLHTAWAYCHVPNAATDDMADRIEAQIERFAPGFKALILARAASPPALLQSQDANLIGGDIAGGRNHLRQLLLRPSLRPYRTPLRGVYLCSASTPPGGGVHGLCGAHAARLALRQLRRGS
jgi:phytoene dehydrogenase-like protein